MIAWLTGLLLQLVPPPAGQILAVILPIFLRAEAQELLPILQSLVKQAENDPTLKTGWDKFKWVVEQDAIQSFKAQKKVPQDFINLLLEGAVQQIKAA